MTEETKELKYEYRTDFTAAELTKAVMSGPNVSTQWDNENYYRRPDGVAAKDGLKVTKIYSEDGGVDDFSYEGGYVPGFGYFKMVEQWNNGDGHEQGYVVEHEESGRFFAQTGWYSSWDSSDWDGDLTEVEETKVTVSRYTSLDGKTVFNDPDERN